MQGVELVERVIEKVKEEGLGILGHAGVPQPLDPARLEQLRFPNGAQPSPSLRAWLAFDASALGWFDDPDRPAFPKRDVGQVARAAYGDEGRAAPFDALVKGPLPDDAYLLPRGRLARRFLYTGGVDGTGEHAVLVLDIDGPPFVSIEHPGFDVWLAFAAGLVFPTRQVLGGFADDERYAPRIREHTDRLFGGQLSLQLGDEGFSPEAKQDLAVEESMLLGPLDALKEGWVVVDEIVNPLTGMPMRLAAPATAVRPRKID